MAICTLSGTVLEKTERKIVDQGTGELKFVINELHLHQPGETRLIKLEFDSKDHDLVKAYHLTKTGDQITATCNVWAWAGKVGAGLTIRVVSVVYQGVAK